MTNVVDKVVELSRYAELVTFSIIATLVIGTSPIYRRKPMTPLRQRVIDEIRLRGYSPRTEESYINALAQLAN